MIFDPARTHADYEALELREAVGFAGGAFTVKSSAPYEAELFRTDFLTLQGKNQSAGAKLLLVKQFSFSPAPHGFEAACEVILKFKETPEKPLAVGIESVINLLAPAEPDRTKTVTRTPVSYGQTSREQVAAHPRHRPRAARGAPFHSVAAGRE